MNINNANVLNATNDDTDLKNINSQIIILLIATSILVVSIITLIYKKYLKQKKRVPNEKKFALIFAITSLFSSLLFLYLVIRNYFLLRDLLQSFKNEKEIFIQKELLTAKIVALTASLLELHIAYQNLAKY